MSLSVKIRKKLGDFTLDVAFESSGGILGLLGASGAGKSMTLRCIAGIERPDSGLIVLDGVTLFDSERGICLPPQQRRVGYLFQNYALFPNMTVRQNILCGLRREKEPRRKQLFEDTVKLLRLEGLEERKPSALSGGEAQRVALARMLVSGPELLLLDEPFSALDSHLRLRLELELKELLQGYGKQVILVTHSRDEAYRMCGDLGVLSGGRVIAMKPTKELFADPGTVEAARITGCKNIVPAVRSGEFEVTVPDWGEARLQTKQPVGNGLKAIGIRAHDWNPAVSLNCNPVAFCGEMEEPFETILLFRFPNQAEGTESIWWRLSAEHRGNPNPTALGIAPDNILLLY